MLRKRSVSLVSCKYEAVIESAWKQTKVRVWVKLVADKGCRHWRQTDSRRRLGPLPLAETMQTVRCCHVSTLHSTSSFFLFFLRLSCLPRPAELAFDRVVPTLHYLGTLNSRYGIVMMTFAARQSSVWLSWSPITPPSSSEPILAALCSTTYFTQGLSSRSHLNIRCRKCWSDVLFTALIHDCLSEFLFV